MLLVVTQPKPSGDDGGTRTGSRCQQSDRVSVRMGMKETQLGGGKKAHFTGLQTKPLPALTVGRVNRRRKVVFLYVTINKVD